MGRMPTRSKRRHGVSQINGTTFNAELAEIAEPEKFLVSSADSAVSALIVVIVKTLADGSRGDSVTAAGPALIAGTRVQRRNTPIGDWRLAPSQKNWKFLQWGS